jgi:hypothetical protein
MADRIQGLVELLMFAQGKPLITELSGAYRKRICPLNVAVGGS